MLPGGLDPLYRSALAAPHTQYLLVEVLDGAGNVLPLPRGSISSTGGLEILEGAVSATLSSRVTRTATITVDQSLYPALPGDLLAPYGNRLRITAGIVLGDGNTRYTWTVFTGRIQQPILSPDGTCTVPASDRSLEVQEAGFLRPQNSQVGSPISTQFRILVSDALPDASFGASDLFEEPMPQLTWESDRAGALDEISTTAGAFWYCLADGDFVQRRYAWTVPGLPILTLRDGQGGLVAGSPSRDRDSVYNSIGVSGERADGSQPVYALAQDLDPTSATYVNGTFGRRHRLVVLQSPQTQGTAQTAANAELRRSIGLFETWRWTQPADAALELGDIVGLDAYGRTGIVQVIAGFALPLNVDAPMSVQAHAQIVGGTR